MGFLAVDIGNTNLSWGLFDGTMLRDQGSLPVDGDWELPLEAWGDLTGAAVASVERDAAQRLRSAWNWSSAPELVFLGEDRPIPVEVDGPDRKQVGADRLVNCLAWHRRCAQPAVIVDFGTAVTFDVVSREGSYRGGLILPGPGVMSRALNTFTSLLPSVEIAPTDEVFGRDTETCVQRGVFGLLVGGVSYHIDALRQCLDPETVFVATGGAAPTFAPWFEGIEVVLPYLTLEGVRLAFESCP